MIFKFILLIILIFPISLIGQVKHEQKKKGLLIKYKQTLFFYEFKCQTSSLDEQGLDSKLKTGYIVIPTIDYYDTLIIDVGKKIEIDNHEDYSDQLRYMYFLPVTLVYKIEKETKKKKLVKDEIFVMKKKKILSYYDNYLINPIELKY